MVFVIKTIPGDDLRPPWSRPRFSAAFHLKISSRVSLKTRNIPPIERNRIFKQRLTIDFFLPSSNERREYSRTTFGRADSRMDPAFSKVSPVLELDTSFKSKLRQRERLEAARRR